MQFCELSSYRAIQEREAAGLGMRKTQKLEGRPCGAVSLSLEEGSKELSTILVLMLVSCCFEDLVTKNSFCSSKTHLAFPQQL